uniref:Uncharacterized protein n=1 Tax=Timema poppense TaxID=170557 RepID=A0A7R9CXL0_TIMPO|nr:unnamed protein product [Timema poppensis]
MGCGIIFPRDYICEYDSDGGSVEFSPSSPNEVDDLLDLTLEGSDSEDEEWWSNNCTGNCEGKVKPAREESHAREKTEGDSARVVATSSGWAILEVSSSSMGGRKSPCSFPPSPLFSVDMAVHLVAIYWGVLLVLSTHCPVDLEKRVARLIVGLRRP